MPAPWNSCPACLIARNDRTGEDSLNLLNRGDVIPLGFTPWNETSAVNCLSFVLLATPSGQNYAISVSYISQLP